MSPVSACNPQLLSDSLGDRLSDEQEEELVRHLSTCQACQQQLEQLAGEQRQWQRISAALKREADSGSLLLAGSDVSHDDAAGIDFAVDFLEPSATPGAVGRLGDIDIQEEIRRGGMGIVLKGFQPELKRLVAVKVMAPYLACSGPARKRFAREAQAAAAILHANVMPILAVNSSGKLPYLVMPYLACESLEQRIARTGPLELVDVLRIGMQTAAGLAAAHAQGLVHRDVKPANILLEKGVDRVLLTDFGLARAVDDASITRTGLIAGTPQFMSPEQARGEAVDARSDLFSLGSVLYTMAAGRPPFRAESTYGILRRIVESPPRRLSEVQPAVPSWLEKIVDKLLAKQPADRFASADAVAELLKRCLAHVQQPYTAPLPDELREPARRASEGQRRLFRGLAISFAAVVLAVVTVVANSGWWQAHEAPDNPSTARELPAASDVPTTNEPVSSDEPAMNWDEFDSEWSDLVRDAEQFEQRAERLWDDAEADNP